MTYVHNAKIPFSEIKLEPDLVLGGEDTNEYYFGDMSIVKEDNEGNIYVIDWRIGDIKKFSYDGEYIKTIGKKGQGPGEFNTAPTDLDFYNDNRMLVSEGNSNKFHIFDPEDNFLKAITRQDKPWRIALNSKNILYENYKIAFNPFAGDASINDKPLLQRSDENFEVIETFGKRKIYDKPILNWYMNSRILGIGKRDNIIACYTRRNAIEIYKSDTLSIVIDRHIYFTPREPEITIKGNSISGKIDGITRGYSVATDSSGNLYILTTCRGTDENPESGEMKGINLLLEIYNSKGWLIYCIPIRKYWPANIFVGKGNKIYFPDFESFTVIRFKTIF
ncbi:6-bladed beta-propeller [candidate division KSB1 bacterium]